MSEANRQLARRWYEEVWNQQKGSTIDELFAANGRAYGFPEPDSVLLGPENFKKVHATFCGAFPNLHIILDDIVCEGNRAAIRWTGTMTHLGDHLGFPASRKNVTLSGSSFFDFQNGKIVDGWNFIDTGSLMQNLKAG